MRWVGIDEAGYGPNLGPLVMTAVVAESTTVERDAKNHRVFHKVSASVSTVDRAMSNPAPAAAPAGSGQTPASDAASADDSDGDPLPPEAEAIADFCHALFNSNEFLYVD